MRVLLNKDGTPPRTFAEIEELKEPLEWLKATWYDPHTKVEGAGYITDEEQFNRFLAMSVRDGFESVEFTAWPNVG